MGLNAEQASYEFVYKVLGDALRAAVASGPGAVGGIGSVPCRASATLYMLLMDHPVDQRGRCRSCWRLRAMLGFRRRFCRVHGKASLCLRQPEEMLRRLLAHELGLAGSSSPTLTTGVAEWLPVSPCSKRGVAKLIGTSTRRHRRRDRQQAR